MTAPGKEHDVTVTDEPRSRSRRERAPHTALGGLALAAVGVVFGDIGTSPLYSLQTVFSVRHNAVAATREDVFGVTSMVFWALTIVVCYGYAFLMMRADNDGEGGILSLVALLRRRAGRRSSCDCSAGSSVRGSGTRRSFPPLPLRTTISRRPKSTSFTRSRTASIKRIPAP